MILILNRHVQHMIFKPVTSGGMSNPFVDENEEYPHIELAQIAPDANITYLGPDALLCTGMVMFKYQLTKEFHSKLPAIYPKRNSMFIVPEGIDDIDKFKGLLKKALSNCRVLRNEESFVNTGTYTVDVIKGRLIMSICVVGDNNVIDTTRLFNTNCLDHLIEHRLTLSAASEDTPLSVGCLWHLFNDL